MSTLDTHGLTFATPSNQENAEEILRLRCKEITDAECRNILAIRTAAVEYRRALEERIWRSKVLEEADVSVCNIRMQREKERVGEEMYQKKAVQGPIRKLPVEMLSAIFRHHVEDDLSPWILVKVSKAWMHTAMNSPHLWCRLLIVSKVRSVSRRVQYVVDGKPHYSVGGMQLCDDLCHLKAALHRSGAMLPLIIKVEQGYGPARDDAISAILYYLLSSPVSERIQELDGMTINISDGEYIPIGTFPRLRSLTLPYHICQWTHRFLDSVSSTSPALDTVVVARISSLELAAHSFWRKIKRVVLTQKTHNDQGLNHVAAHLSSLEHIEAIPWNWPTEDTPAAVWGNIRQLSLSCDARYLGRLQLPRMETLTLRVFGHENHRVLSEYDQLAYPSLINLEVEVNGPLWPQYTAGAFPALLNLALTCRENDEVIVAILKSIPTVRNVKILGPASKTFGFDMLQDLQSDEGSLICPNLERLTLGGSEPQRRVRTLKSNNGPLCKSLVEFRREIGRPLQEFTVYWDYRKEVIDYTTIV